MAKIDIITSENLYGMELGQTLRQGSNITIIRVPGGWIFITEDTFVNAEIDIPTMSSVFVPYSSEFKK